MTRIKMHIFNNHVRLNAGCKNGCQHHGDRNTAFYRVSKLVRRKRNQIGAMKKAAGEWMSEESQIKEFI